MHWGLVKTIIVLPGAVMVFIQGAIVLFTHSTRFSAEWTGTHQVWFWVALLAAGMGVGLLFGKLVIRGPYRHVGNPMITGVLLVLFSEALFFRSWPIALWMILFFFGNSVYFPLIEEKGLKERFGDDYREYKSHVPCWIPRLRAWNQKSGGQ